MDIHSLILQHESRTLEFKKDLSSLEPVVKTIVAFANTAGGILIIGRAPDGSLVGVKDVLKAEEALANVIADCIRPAILPEIEIATVNGKNLILVKVSHWKGPFYVKKEGIPKGVYIRLGSTNRPCSPELLEELQRSSSLQSYDQQPLPELSEKDLQIDLFEKRFRNSKCNALEKMRSLNIVTPFRNRLVPTVGGMILFGKNESRQRAVPDARIRCARFLGTTKTHILDQYDVEGTPLDAIEEVPKFILRNTRLAAEFQGMYRKDIPEYTPLAIREALVNAMVHADYSMGGAHIQIAIFDDRLEIQNPGMFPFGFTFADFKMGVSRVRNRVLARIFHELDLMEEWGNGYRRIIDTCNEGGYPEPKWEELGTFMRVTFYPHGRTVLHTVEEKPAQYSVEELTDREMEILTLFKGQIRIPFREIRNALESQISERTLRYDLANLKKKGLLISKGKGRGLIWQRKTV